jgi:hypothetical protein
MSYRKLALSTLLSGLSVSLALACGPNFPWQLLDDRAATMKAVPANSFAFEAAHLAPAPRDHLQAAENTDFWDDFALDKARDKAELEGLTAAQADLLHRVR